MADDLDAMMAEFDNFDDCSNSPDESGSGASTDQDDDFTDTDAAIDRMLDELQDFQMDLEQEELDVGLPGSQGGRGDTLRPNVSTLDRKINQLSSMQSMDHLNFSLGQIEESPDVDLDALLEDLCAMEKDFNKGEDEDTESGVSSDSCFTINSSVSSLSMPGVGKGSRPVSPAKVTSDVRNRLESLQNELDSRELTPEEQEARIKAEKIRIALEKMKAASVQKLVVKVYDEDLQTAKTMLIDQTWTARDVASKMIKKDDVEIDPNWCVIETLPDMHIERILEDSEHVLHTVSDWTRDSSNALVFSKRRDKYALFRNPQRFLLGSATSSGAAQLAEKSKDILLQEFFMKDNTRIPDVDDILWLREGKKSWNKHFFTLRASGIYYTPKGKTKSSRDLICLVKFEHASVYLGVGYKKKFKAPTEHVFVLKHPKVQTLKSKHVYSICCETQKTMQLWVVAIRMAKYGYQLYQDYLRTQEDVERGLMLSGLGNRTSSISTSTSASTTESRDLDGSSIFDEISMGSNSTISRRRSEKNKSLPRNNKKISQSSAPRVKVSNLGDLFADAWKKGTEEIKGDRGPTPDTPETPSSDGLMSPKSEPVTFDVQNRASFVYRAANGDVPRKGAAAIALDPAPRGRNNSKEKSDSGFIEEPVTHPEASVVPPVSQALVRPAPPPLSAKPKPPPPPRQSSLEGNTLPPPPPPPSTKPGRQSPRGSAPPSPSFPPPPDVPPPLDLTDVFADGSPSSPLPPPPESLREFLSTFE